MGKRGDYKIYIQYFFLFFFTLLLVPPSFYHRPVEGLDASWDIAIHLAYKYHLVFGKDFVFTYGPLGILHSRHPISINLFVYLSFDLYFLGTLFFVMKKIFASHFSIGLVFFIFLGIITTMYESFEVWFFFFFLFYLFSFLKESDKRIYLAQAILLSLILFYFKMGLGMIVILIFLAIITYLFIRKKINYKVFLSIIFLYILCIGLSAILLHVDLKGYITTGLYLINGYNDSMFTNIDSVYFTFIIKALSIILIIAMWIIYRIFVSFRKKEFIKNSDEIVVYGVLALAMYIFFKLGFVRGEGHFHVFFKGAILLSPFLYLYSRRGIQRKIARVCSWLVLIISFWAMKNVPGSYRPYSRIKNLSFLPIKLEEIKNYVRGIVDYNKALAASDNLDREDNELKKIIGNATIDIIPFEISRIYFYGLHYNPRPVIQSYAAYNEYLDNLNYQKYMSAGAPDYILFSLNSIDGRFPFFDESKTKLALLDRYRIVGEFKGDLILKKKTTKSIVLSKEVEVINLTFGQDISVRKTNDLQYSRFIIDYSNWGKLRRFFYKPPELKITFTLENGETRTFRAIKPILAEGVLVNKYIDAWQEFQFLMQSKGLLNSNIKKIRIGPDSIHSGFKDNIKMVTTYYKFRDKSAAEQIADSLSIVELLNRFKPVEIDSSVLTVDNVRIGTAYYKNHSQIIEISGWAYRENANNENAIIKTILLSKNKIYELPTTQLDRSDVAAYFKRQDISNAGFISTVSRHQLQPGDYQIGIAVMYRDSLKKWFNYIPDNHLLIRSNYKIEKLISVQSLQVPKNDIEYNISSMEENGNDILIDGWAFFKDADSKNTKINLILQDTAGMIYRLNTDVIRRTDVSSYFKNPLLDNSGFATIISKDSLAPGMYILGIEAICCNGRSSLSMSDKKISIIIKH
jgi:hypothetical protein